MKGRAFALVGLASSLWVLGCAPAHREAFDAPGLATGAPAPNVWPEASPGSTAPLPRPYPGAPPAIPHSIDGLTIARDTNDCLSCHLDGMEVDEGHVATRVPDSHRANPFTEKPGSDGVIGTRHNCTQCHVPQTAAVPPVGVR